MVDGLGEGPVLVVVRHHAGLAGHVQLTALGLSKTHALQLVLQAINRRCFHNHEKAPTRTFSCPYLVNLVFMESLGQTVELLREIYK